MRSACSWKLPYNKDTQCLENGSKTVKTSPATIQSRRPYAAANPREKLSPENQGPRAALAGHLKPTGTFRHLCGNRSPRGLGLQPPTCKGTAVYAVSALSRGSGGLPSTGIHFLASRFYSSHLLRADLLLHSPSE